MTPGITLFSLRTDYIRVTITACFEGEDLVVEGYDIGKNVSDWFGDSDYEYSVRVKKNDLPALCRVLGCDPGDKDKILQKIAKRFKGNSCYSEFCDFLTKYDIPGDGFSWA